MRKNLTKWIFEGEIWNTRLKEGCALICQFTVKNFQCLKEETTFDFQATNISEHEESLITSADGERFLPLGVIYGPNGSGKSTVLQAMYTLASKIMRPICAVGCDNEECLKKNNGVSIKPFYFSKDTINLPTEFELFFRTSKNEYQYLISFLKNKIISEELYRKSISGTRYSTLFKRKNSGKIELKGTFRTYNCDNISDNLPLLSFLGITHRRNATIKDIVNWFENQIDFINYGNPNQDASVPIAKSEKLKSLVLKMMVEMDLGISDYRVEENQENLKVYTEHVVNNKKYELELSEESNGTIKIFGILPYLADALLKGAALVVDELDAKLHPLLLKYVISLFSNPEVNKNGAQLIFTSHDLSTMNSETFRRDEIWFIAKGENSASNLYSLIEFKKEDGTTERKDARYDKRYLEGRYGADPYFRKIIDWGEY